MKCARRVSELITRMAPSWLRTAQTIFLQQWYWNFLGAFNRVNTESGLLNHAMADVGADDFPRCFAKCLGQLNRQGIGFFAGGAGRAPGAKWRAGRVSGQDVLAQVDKMLRFAEKWVSLVVSRSIMR